MRLVFGGVLLEKYVDVKMITSPELLTSIKYPGQMETNRRKNILNSISSFNIEEYALVMMSLQ